MGFGRGRNSRVRRLLSSLTVACLAASALVLASSTGLAPRQTEAQAADASQFRAGNLISDANFYNGSAMTTEQVQAFLTAQVPTCRAGYTCLKDYAAATPSKPAESGNCAAYSGSARESAASIITRVGQACGISQKAMLTLLQKEQGLVTDSWPTDRQYRSATGYGCPDTADCDATYYGFFNQVYMAALQFKRYAANPTNWKHVAGRTNSILYHPNAACGSSSVFIENTATAGLYNYTPYQPNAAALANLYGTGDACSAYGNRNFWRIYTDWFGSPTGVPPRGAWNTVSGDGGVTVTGWVAYPDAPTEVGNAIVQIGSKSYTLRADGPSPGVNGVIPGAGDNHGYAGTIPTPPGDYYVCVSASTRSGGQSLLGCLNLTVLPAPVAEWTTSHGDGGVTVTGWAVYPNALAETARVSVAVGPTRFTLTADKPSDAAAARFPSAGRMHGYSGTVPAPPGTHPVCVYVLHRSVGESLVGCLTQTVTQGPISEWSTSTGTGGAVRVTGWSFYPDAPTTTVPISVDIDGTRHKVAANSPSPGLDARYPGVGDRHGYTASIPATVGNHRVCVYSTHRSVGETLLGCLTQYVEPVKATAEWSTSTGVGGAVQVSGWAFYTDDPTRTVSAAVYIDGVRTLVPADQPSPGLNSRYPGAGDNHGYRASIPASPGNHRVCVAAVHPTAGETLLGCLTQNVTTGPVAEWSTSTGTGGAVTVTGWAFHPDARTETATVAVSIDGVRHPLTANQPSPGLDAKYPGTGDNHGYRGSIPTTSGNHNVCVYVLTRAGAEQLVGCLTQYVEPVKATAEWSTSTGVGGAVQVSGWAFYTDDPTRTVSAAVYIDGVRTLVPADQPSPGLNSRYPGAGDNHGYRASIPASPGNHRVCVAAVHPTAGETLLGCLTQNVTTGPVAEWSTSTGTGGAVTVTGWAFHPDARTETATVAVSIDGVRHPLTANQPSPGLDAKYPGTGDNHGYRGSIPTTSGNHNVCVYVLTRAGAEQLVGCLTQYVQP